MVRKLKSKQFRKILYQDVRLNLTCFVYIYGIISFPLIFNAVNFSLGCAGCGEDIRSGQSLLALEKQWHLWCFTCTKCGCLLAGEYMGRLVQSHIISILFSGVSWKIEPGCCYLIVYSAEPQGLESVCFVISCVLWRSTIALWQLIIQHIRKGDIFS